MTLYQSRGNVTLENDTAKILDLTVPKGKKWIIYDICVQNGDDVARTIWAGIRDENGNPLAYFGSAASVNAGSYTTLTGFCPTSATLYTGRVPMPIKGGNKLRIYWAAGGASSGGTAYYCITYEEVPE